jgi:hypothetical protein
MALEFGSKRLLLQNRRIMETAQEVLEETPRALRVF